MNEPSAVPEWMRWNDYGIGLLRKGGGVAFLDYDADGDLDLFVGNYVRWSKEIDFELDFRLTGVGRAFGPPQNYEGTYPYLYRNEGDGTFTEVAAEAPLQVDASQSYRQPSQLFWNAGDQGFVPVGPEVSGDLAREIVGRGAAYADIDLDGDLDVVLTQIAGPPLLLRNDQATGHHWLRVRLEGRPPNRDAIGAWFELSVGRSCRPAVTCRRSSEPSPSAWGRPIGSTR